MYAGRIVERGTVDEVLDTPLHPYTRACSIRCRAATPAAPLRQIPGMTPSLLACREAARSASAARARPSPAALRGAARDAARSRTARARCFHPIHARRRTAA